LPEIWAKDRKRRKEAGIPEEISFATKPTIALQQIRQAIEEEVSSLFRNVPLFTSLEVSLFFALLLSLGPPPERSPAPRFGRRV
jgi:DDE superfamily endonuclease